MQQLALSIVRLCLIAVLGPRERLAILELELLNLLVLQRPPRIVPSVKPAFIKDGRVRDLSAEVSNRRV